MNAFVKLLEVSEKVNGCTEQTANETALRILRQSSSVVQLDLDTLLERKRPLWYSMP